tara:strand:- start:1150 stop:1662 length:513 start_codon:yes stop_codon:yes gene_type:complete
MNEKKILNEIKEYFDYLQTPNEAFGGMAVCPFLKAEIQNNKLMVEIWRPEEQSFSNMFHNFLDSEYESAILICMNTEGIDWSQVDRVKYQSSIQNVLKESEYKALCFSPFEEHTAAGEETRKKSPYFLINIAKTSVLNEAHRKLLKTKYFDNFNDKEVKILKVYPKGDVL